MPNVFRDSSAPYILVLILTVTGWMFNSAINSAEKLRIIEYRIENGKDGGVATKTLLLANRSLTGPINVGSLVLECTPPTPQTPCLATLPSAKLIAQFLEIGNVRLPVNPTPLSDHSVGISALLPPRGKAGYRIGVTDINVTIRLVYNVEYDPVAKTQPDLEVVLIEDKPFDWTPDGLSNKILPFIFSNYITILLSVIIILMSTIGLWVIFEFLRLLFGKKPSGSKEKIIANVTIEGRTREVTVEEL